MMIALPSHLVKLQNADSIAFRPVISPAIHKAGVRQIVSIYAENGAYVLETNGNNDIDDCEALACVIFSFLIYLRLAARKGLWALQN
jgi:hypothetical protein